MDETKKQDEKKRDIFPGAVVEVLSEYRLVINRGRTDSIMKGQRFLIYRVSEDEIIDPETKEKLGHLEIVIGIGKATHVQEKLTTIDSDMKESTEKFIRRNIPNVWGFGEEERVSPDDKPFESPEVGNKVKPV